MPAAPASRAAGREVTPVELFRLLPAHFAAVLVCTLLGGILAFAAARLAPRSYQAEAQLYVAAAQEGLTSGYAELQLTADYQELLTSRTMLGRLGTPEDQAAAVAFLASDDAAWITGLMLDVNGGMYWS